MGELKQKMKILIKCIYGDNLPEYVPSNFEYLIPELY